MRKIIFICLLGFQFNLLAQRGEIEIEFLTTETFSYCKGVAPMDDEISKLLTPKFTQKKLYIYPIEKNKKGKYFTVDSGNKIKLKPGKYLVSFDNNISKSIFKNFDESQLKVNQKIITIDVSLVKSFTINYHHYCAWELNPNISPAP